jgi:hypothetical protein
VSSTLPPDFDLSRLRGIPDPAGSETAEAPEPPVFSREAPARGERVLRQKLALLLGAGWLVGQLVFLGARQDLSEVPLSYLVALVLAPLAAAGLALGLAVTPGRLGLGARSGVLTAVALILPTYLIVAGLVMSPAHENGPPGNLRQGLYCFAMMLLWAALPLAAAAVVLRSWFVTRAPLRSALVGVAAGMGAAAMINLHCFVTGALHVAIGHWLAVAVAALVGVFSLAKRTRV